MLKASIWDIYRPIIINICASVMLEVVKSANKLSGLFMVANLRLFFFFLIFVEGSNTIAYD